MNKDSTLTRTMYMQTTVLPSQTHITNFPNKTPQLQPLLHVRKLPYQYIIINASEPSIRAASSYSVQLRAQISSMVCVKPSPKPSFTGTSVGVWSHFGHSLFLTSDDRIQMMRLCLQEKKLPSSVE